MPETQQYGFVYETPQTKPGITLTGDSDGSAAILAEQVEGVIASIDTRVAANEGAVSALQTATPTDTGWISLSVTAESGFEVNSAVYRRWGPVTGVSIELLRTGSDIQAISAGNIPDTDMCVINTVAARPDQPFTVIGRCFITSGNVDIETSGVVQLTDLHSNSALRTDDTIRINAVYFVNTFS